VEQIDPSLLRRDPTPRDVGVLMGIIHGSRRGLPSCSFGVGNEYSVRDGSYSRFDAPV
jgi:hypothetical protein